MKAFSLEEYLKDPSRKVVTRDGRKVRIICTDRKSKDNRTIIALIEDFGGDENFLCYPSNGEWPTCRRIDLFFAPEKHEGWVNIYKAGVERVTMGYLASRYVGSCIWPTEEAAKTAADPDPVATIKIEWEE